VLDQDFVDSERAFGERGGGGHEGNYNARNEAVKFAFDSQLGLSIYYKKSILASRL
jgi:hypothetical protein